MLDPTDTLPKLIAVGFGVRVPSVTPEPATGMFSVGFDASLTIETVPASAPVAWGTNVTVNGTLCPAAKVNGRLTPLKLKPVPTVVSCEM